MINKKQWNELDYATQVKVMSLVENLALKQPTAEMQEAIEAALFELSI